MLLSDAVPARVSSIVSVTPGRQERVQGASELITVHGLLEVQAVSEAAAG